MQAIVWVVVLMIELLTKVASIRTVSPEVEEARVVICVAPTVAIKDFPYSPGRMDALEARADWLDPNCI
jgi:hypothetical protein